MHAGMMSLNALSSWRPLDTATQRWNTSLERVGTMRRINSAADDAAGSAISERFAAELRGLQAAQRGAQDGMSMAEVADGALGSVSENLQRMRELAVQSRNGTNSDADRASLDKEYQQLSQEVSRVVGGTSFNGQHLLGEDAGARQVSTGAGSGDTLTLTTPDLRSDPDLSAATGGSVATAAGSKTSIDAIDKALESIGSHRATLGAGQSRLQAVSDQIDLQFESTARSYGRQVDADPAREFANLRMAQVQHYAATQMLKMGGAGPLLSLLG